MIRLLKTLLILCLLFVLFVFGSQNPHLVKINFIIASANIPLAYIVSISCALGVTIGITLGLVVISSTKLHNARLEKLNNKLSNNTDY